MCSCDQSLLILAFLWEKLSQPQFYKDFFEEWSWFKFRLALGTGTRYNLETLYQWDKRVKTKSQKVFGPNFYVYRSYSEETGRGVFCTPLNSPPPILNRVKTNFVNIDLIWEIFYIMTNLFVYLFNRIVRT